MSGKKNESKCWHRSKIPPDLTVDWLVEQLDAGCPRSGYKWPEDVIIPEHLRPSLDRIDSRHGYTKDNVQVVIRIYNYAKNKFSDYDVIESARMIVAHADQRHGLVNTLADMRVGFAPMLHHD